MSRLPELRKQDLSAEQLALFEAIASGPRGERMALEGPFGVWLHSPAFGQEAQRLGVHARYHTSLPRRLSELAILVCARRWLAAYEWHVHAPIALAAGVAPAIIDALAEDRTPAFTAADEQAVHDFAAALLADGHVPDRIYAAARTALGEAGVVDLVGVLGYYTLVAFTLTAFEVQVPPDRPVSPGG